VSDYDDDETTNYSAPAPAVDRLADGIALCSLAVNAKTIGAALKKLRRQAQRLARRGG
jgi:hypothetical protein